MSRQIAESRPRIAPVTTPRDRPEPVPSDSRHALRRSLAFLRSYRRDTIGAVVALLLVSSANLISPQLIRLAIDSGIDQGRPDVIALTVGGLILVAIGRGLFTFLQAFLAERASQGVAYDLREALFARIERLSFSYYDRVQTGQLVTRLTSDVEQIRTFVGSGTVQLVAAVVMLSGSTVLLFSLNWKLALASLCVIPVILFQLYRFVRRIGPLFRAVQQSVGQLNSILQEDLSGLRVVRSFAREGLELERFRAINDDLLAKNLRTIRVFSNNFPFVFFFGNLGTLAVVWFGGSQVMAGELTIGELVAFNTYLAFMLFPLLTIGFLAGSIPRAAASSVRVFEVLDAPLEIRDAPGAIPLPSIEGRVELRDVHFRYPSSDREILRGIDVTVEPGQTVAILGTTGAGKSTLVNLIPRFYDVTAGAVLIDGHDVRDVTLASLRSQIAVVLQEALLFSGTVRENIAYGRPDASDEEVVAAARAAQAQEFIDDLPQGYDTVIGERGIGLSGGQRQRIAIARALLADRCLLILDDSTSAVDAGTEVAIRAALDRLIRDRERTAFVIAQRISTVRDADVILVLDEGRIAARGTHEQLLRESPLYNEILGSQLIRDDR